MRRRKFNPGDLARLLTSFRSARLQPFVPEPQPKGWEGAYERASYLLLESRTGLRGADLQALASFVWDKQHGVKLTQAEKMAERMAIPHVLQRARATGDLQELALKIEAVKQALEHYCSSHSSNLRERILTAYRNRTWKLKRLPYVPEIQEEMKILFPKNPVPNPKTIWDQLHKDSLPRNPRGWPKGKKRE
jgi:hypothetical protein